MRTSVASAVTICARHPQRDRMTYFVLKRILQHQILCKILVKRL